MVPITIEARHHGRNSIANRAVVADDVTGYLVIIAVTLERAEGKAPYQAVRRRGTAIHPVAHKEQAGRHMVERRMVVLTGVPGQAGTCSVDLVEDDLATKDA